MSLERFASLAFFNGLSADEISMLAPFFTSRTLVAGTVIFDQGDPARFLYVVFSGEVVIRYKPDDGPVMTVTRIPSGNVFGWSAAVGNEVYTSGAICSLDSELLFIRGEDLRFLCQVNERIRSVLLEHLSIVVAERQKSGHVSHVMGSKLEQDSRIGGKYDGRSES